MSVLLSITVALFAGLMMTRVLKRFHLPDVTSYLIAGVLVGPYCLGKLGISGVGFQEMPQLDALGNISNAALGFIAFAIGSEFRLSELKETGKQALVVGILQGIVAMIFVDVALIVLHFLMPDKLSLPAAITLGAIATATAPAATLMVVRQFKAKGKVTKLLLPVVALDDAVGLVCFAASFGIAQAIQSGEPDLKSILLEPVLEIILSILLGALFGWLLTQLEKLFHSNSNRLNLVICFVVLTVAVSMVKFELFGIQFSFSTLLVLMMMGTVFCNICPLSFDLMERADRWTSPLFALFFVLSGAQLELGVFSDILIVLVGLVYILFRSAGKFIGSYGSTRMMKCDPMVQKYLGWTLLPQAGVALGMCVTAMSLGEDGSLIRNIILFSVLIYELLGPMLTKWALTKSGDIIPPERVDRRKEKLDAIGANTK